MKPLHYAASRGRPAVIRLLLQAAPQVALTPNRGASTPVMLALSCQQYEAARCLLQLQPTPLPTAYLLKLMNRQRRRQQWEWEPQPMMPLDFCTILASRQAIEPADWARVPTPCPGLAAALPTVLRRSEEEAALLVGHLLDGERQRLRTAALCLGRVQRSSGTPLPPDILRPLLLAAVEDGA